MKHTLCESLIQSVSNALKQNLLLNETSYGYGKNKTYYSKEDMHELALTNKLREKIEFLSKKQKVFGSDNLYFKNFNYNTWDLTPTVTLIQYPQNLQALNLIKSALGIKEIDNSLMVQYQTIKDSLENLDKYFIKNGKYSKFMENKDLVVNTFMKNTQYYHGDPGVLASLYNEAKAQHVNMYDYIVQKMQNFSQDNDQMQDVIKLIDDLNSNLSYVIEKTKEFYNVEIKKFIDAGIERFTYIQDEKAIDRLNQIRQRYNVDGQILYEGVSIDFIIIEVIKYIEQCKKDKVAKAFAVSDRSVNNVNDTIWSVLKHMDPNYIRKDNCTMASYKSAGQDFTVYGRFDLYLNPKTANPWYLIDTSSFAVMRKLQNAE